MELCYQQPYDPVQEYLRIIIYRYIICNKEVRQLLKRSYFLPTACDWIWFFSCVPYDVKLWSLTIAWILVSSPYIEVRMDTSGPYALVKERMDTSRICTPTRHTGYTHTLHVMYTIDKHSLRARFLRAIYMTRKIFTSTLYARTIYAPTYAYNQCQRITCTIYVPNLCVKLMS